MASSILIVESDNLVRLTLSNIFEFFEYHVVDTGSPEIALSMLLGVWFGTIILCSTMDDPDGRQIAWEAKAIQPHIKTIVIGGLGRPKHLPPFVDAFVAKPFSIEDILRAVQAVRTRDREDFGYKTPRAKK